MNQAASFAELQAFNDQLRSAKGMHKNRAKGKDGEDKSMPRIVTTPGKRKIVSAKLYKKKRASSAAKRPPTANDLTREQIITGTWRQGTLSHMQSTSHTLVDAVLDPPPRPPRSSLAPTCRARDTV